MRRACRRPWRAPGRHAFTESPIARHERLQHVRDPLLAIDHLAIGLRVRHGAGFEVGFQADRAGQGQRDVLRPGQRPAPPLPGRANGDAPRQSPQVPRQSVPAAAGSAGLHADAAPAGNGTAGHRTGQRLGGDHTGVRLLEIAVTVPRNARRIRLMFALHHPVRELFALAAARSGAARPSLRAPVSAADPSIAATCRIVRHRRIARIAGMRDDGEQPFSGARPRRPCRLVRPRLPAMSTRVTSHRRAPPVARHSFEQSAS